MDNNYSELTDSLSGVSDDYGNDSCGEFSKDIRNLIVTIMKSGCISYADNEEIYNLYLRNRRQINSYLANINLRMVLDEAEGIAYLANYVREETDDEDSGEKGRDLYLISPRKLSAFDSVVLLLLREYYHSRVSEGETTVVLDLEHLEDMLVPFFNDYQSGSRKDRMKTNGALKRLEGKHLIKIINSSEGDRIRIQPIIRTVISLEFLRKQLDAYRKFYKTHDVKDPDDEQEPEEL